MPSPFYPETEQTAPSRASETPFGAGGDDAPPPVQTRPAASAYELPGQEPPPLPELSAMPQSKQYGAPPPGAGAGGGEWTAVPAPNGGER